MNNPVKDSKESTEKNLFAVSRSAERRFDANQFWKYLFENADKVAKLVKWTLIGVAIIIAVCKGHIISSSILTVGSALMEKIRVSRAP